jgi:hypothetical protein
MQLEHKLKNFLNKLNWFERIFLVAATSIWFYGAFWAIYLSVNETNNMRSLYTGINKDFSNPECLSHFSMSYEELKIQIDTKKSHGCENIEFYRRYRFHDNNKDVKLPITFDDIDRDLNRRWVPWVRFLIHLGGITVGVWALAWYPFQFVQWIANGFKK